MFTFAHPQYLYLLALLPLVALLYWWARRRRIAKLKRYGKLPQVERLAPTVSPYKPALRLTVELLLLAVVIVMLARPRSGTRLAKGTVSSLEVMIAIDVSNSMNAPVSGTAHDVSRLSRAKLLTEKLINHLKNERVGLLVFAGDADIIMPLTTDAQGAKMYLNDISCDMVATQGTAIGDAIDLANESLGIDSLAQRSIIIITDAENHEDNAVEAAARAAQAGTQINVVGVGSEKGTQIPDKQGEPMTDEEGRVITTALDEAMAQQIATAGKGTYVNADDNDALEDLSQTLDKLANGSNALVTYTQHGEQFPWLAWIALALLVAHTLLLLRKNKWLGKINFFTRENKS